MPNDDGILKKKKKKREKIPFKKFNKFFNNVFKQQMYLEKCTFIKLPHYLRIQIIYITLSPREISTYIC